MAEQESIFEGVGIDIFVRKQRPGSYVGEGYIIDVFQNGVKLETIYKETKKEVAEVLKDYKRQYGTERAFQNEIQYHITYKSKDFDKRGVMDTYDNVLLKKAAQVHELLYRVIDPSTPVKVRQAANALVEGTFDVLPETPLGGPNEEASPTTLDTDINEDTLSSVIIREVIKYFVDIAPSTSTGKAEWPPKDDLYNTMKKWFSTVKKRIREYATTNNKNLNLEQIAKKVADVLQSGDINKLQPYSDEKLSSEIAAKIKEISILKVGGDTEMGSKDLTSGILGKAACTKLDTLKNKLLNVVSESNASGGVGENDIEQYIERLDSDEEGILHNILSNKGDKNHSEQALQSYLENDLIRTNKIDRYASECWDYITKYAGISTLEKVYEEWVNTTDLSLKEAQIIYDVVSNHINDLFNVRSARLTQVFAQQEPEIISQFASTVNATKVDALTFENLPNLLKDSVFLNGILPDFIIFYVRRFGGNSPETRPRTFDVLLSFMQSTVNGSLTLIQPYARDIHGVMIKALSTIIGDKKRNKITSLANGNEGSLEALVPQLFESYMTKDNVQHAIDLLVSKGVIKKEDLFHPNSPELGASASPVESQEQHTIGESQAQNMAEEVVQ